MSAIDRLSEPQCCCYDLQMPSPALLQAVSRLDQAISSAESAFDSYRKQSADQTVARDETVRQALAELNEVINSLAGDAHG